MHSTLRLCWSKISPEQQPGIRPDWNPSQGDNARHWIGSPFELKKGKTVLPPGNYVLFQVNISDPRLFALYEEDMTHAPIAMIRTTRINYSARYPGKTKLLMDTDESWPQKYPVLEGWNIPGDDGWEVIGTVTRLKGLNSRR